MSKLMNLVDVQDYDRAMAIKAHVTLGHYFVYVDDVQALRGKTGGGGRRERLLLADRHDGARVLPLVEHPVELPGVSIRVPDRRSEPLGCLVTDRDLYRAEQNTVHLFIAFPSPPARLRLRVDCNGAPFTERAPELEEGLGIEMLSMLLPGEYMARMEISGRTLGTPVHFTVAEYTLAPFSARLSAHRLDREHGELLFELAVESYQQPFSGPLHVALVDGSREGRRLRVEASAPGEYGGRLPLRGNGSFRLRISAVEDAERLAEVVIPGSRKVERETTVFNELGQETRFALMPEPEALPLRGGYLVRGDYNATPLTVAETVTDRPVVWTNAEVEALVLVVLDLASGAFQVQELGTVEAGRDISVASCGSLCTVFVGCFVDGRPFEGYATFIGPNKAALVLDAPHSAAPGDELAIRIRCQAADGKVPVLLAVRDQRLTATEAPDVSLGAALKRAVAAATEEMDAGFTPLAEVMFPEPVYAAYLEEPLTGGMDSSVVMSAALDGLEMPRLSRRAKETAAEQPARDRFPEVLFYGIVPVAGEETVNIVLGDTLGTLTVEAFALHGDEWMREATTVVVDKPVRCDLELPPAVHPGDRISGRLRVAAPSGKAKVTLEHDGQPVTIVRAGGSAADPEQWVTTPAELEFPVLPGIYRARVEDAETGEGDAVEHRVEIPGRFRSYAKAVEFLQAGDTLSLDSADALALRVLPGLEQPFEDLLAVTADYTHLCCEQTAAKILAAVFMYLTSREQTRQVKAEKIILSGIARERKMLQPGKGFRMYPDSRDVSKHYSRLTVRYLWSLQQLHQVQEISARLRDAVQEGVAMVDTAAKAHGMKPVPKSLQSMEDAYAAAVNGKESPAVADYVEAALVFSSDGVRPAEASHAVADRALLAYAAACLLALGDLRRGVAVASQMTRHFNDRGGLYSTVDSAAAIVLMIQLQTARVGTGNARLRVNGGEMGAREAAALGDQLETLEVLDGVAPIEITRIREHDWNDFNAAFPLEVGFRDERGRSKSRFRIGDRTELQVRLPDGYRAGDLVHVSLPASMAWIRGGGKVKRFTLDFAGSDKLRIPLAVTSTIEGRQHFALCVRNMFEEERATSPGLLSVQGPRTFELRK